MAGKVDGAVYIETKLGTEGFKAGSKDLEAAMRRTAQKVSGIGDAAKIALQKQVNSFSQLNQQYAKQEQKVESLKNKLKELSESKVKTDAYKALETEFYNLEASLKRAEERKEKFLAKGGRQSSGTFRGIENDIDSLNSKMDIAWEKMQKLESEGGAYVAPDTSGLEQNLIAEQEKLSQMGYRLGTSFDSLKSKLQGYGQELESVASASSQSRAVIQGIGNAIKKIPRRIGTGIVSGIKKIGSAALNSAKSVLGLNKGTSSFGSTLSKGFFTILKYTVGIRSLYILVNKLRSAMVDGFQNLAQYSNGVNASISSVKSSLTQFKNSLATAFAPILTVVAPIISKLINMLSQAITYIGMFFATLTGQKSFTKAKAVQEDYAAGLSGTASAAKDAAGATKEAAKANEDYLSGLDEISKFSEDDKSSSGSSSGGGSGAGGVSVGDMFETVDIPSAFDDLADKMKEAWEKADFTEIGTIVGTKLRDALNNVPWDEIKKGAEKIARVTGTFLNGFFETPELFETIGNTIAQGFNTALTFVKTFLDTVHWDSIGKSIVTGIINFFKNIDYSLLGGTVSSFAKGLFDLIRGAFEAIDWSNLPMTIINAIKDFFTGFDWKGAFSSFGELIGTVVASAINLGKAIYDVLKNANDNIRDYFVQHIIKSLSGLDKDASFMDIGKAIIQGILNGIIDILKNIGTWIKENILQPFVDGFRSAFSIHSPSKNPDILDTGKNIMLGILNGVIKGLGKPAQWVRNNILKPLLKAFKNAEDFFQDAGETIWAGITNAFGAVSKVLDVAVGLIKKGWTTVKDWVSTYLGGAVSKAISIARNGWTTVRDWIVNKFFGSDVSKGIGLSRNGWTTLKDWAASFTGGALNKWVGLSRNGWTTLKDWAASFTGGALNKLIGLEKNGWTTVADWVQRSIGKTITIGIGLASQIRANAMGGIYKNGQWQSIQGYASGGSPKSARLFYANENGIPELVGRIGSNTAVMNNAQIVASVAAGVFQAVVSAFGQLQSYFASMTISLADIPKSIDTLANSLPTFNAPMPVMATGTVIPPSVSINQKSIDDLQESISGLKDLIGNINLRTTSDAANNRYEFVAQINRRTIFDEIITEAKLRQMNNGRNPFELA